MIVKETHPGMIYSRKYFDLSDSEKERIQEICDELRSIFNADSVGFIAPELTLGNKRDYEIKIYRGDSIGHIVTDWRNEV